MRSSESPRSTGRARLRSRNAGAAIAIAVAASGCVDQILVDRFVSDVRRGATAADTVHDFDLARSALQGNLGHFEILHRLSPDNEDGLFMLTRGWAQMGSLFLLDEAEEAFAAGDRARALHEVERAGAALARARYYARAFLTQRDDGFERAVADPGALRSWLRDEFDDEADAATLLWCGAAWAPHVPDPLFGPRRDIAVGYALVARALELDEGAEHGLGHVIAGLYFASRPRPDPTAARRHLARAVELSQKRLLAARLGLATVERCSTGDEGRYTAELRAIAGTGDVLPSARVANMAAIRAARRRLDGHAPFDPCRAGNAGKSAGISGKAAGGG